MKQEWYEYAVSIKKRVGDKINGIPILAVAPILVVFSIPLMMHNIWAWLIIMASYCVVSIVNHLGKDPYAKFLLDVGSSLGVLGAMILSLIFAINADESYLAFIFTLFAFIFYEIVVLVKIGERKYSSCVIKKSSKGIWLGTSGVLTGSALGRFLLSRDNNTLFFALLAAVACAVVFVFAISFWQRYIIYKIANSKISKDDLN